MSDLKTYRAAKDDYFSRDPQSPLTIEQRHTFSGLNYFPEDIGLRFEVKVTPLPGSERIEMQTSTGEVQIYRRHARFDFLVEGKVAELTIFEGPSGFFLPFVDSLAGRETYPAGRYLEPEPLPGGRFLIDFNLAYNPYCAYNENWSCPITPAENRLMVPVRAGEKLFQVDH